MRDGKPKVSKTAACPSSKKQLALHCGKRERQGKGVSDEYCKPTSRQRWSIRKRPFFLTKEIGGKGRRINASVVKDDRRKVVTPFFQLTDERGRTC